MRKIRSVTAVHPTCKTVPKNTSNQIISVSGIPLRAAAAEQVLAKTDLGIEWYLEKGKTAVESVSFVDETKGKEGSLYGQAPRPLVGN